MATKKGNGHDKATVEMVEILREIRGELKGTNARLDVVHEDLTALTARVTSIENELRGLRRETIHDMDEVKERLAKVEAVVFKPTGT